MNFAIPNKTKVQKQTQLKLSKKFNGGDQISFLNVNSFKRILIINFLQNEKKVTGNLQIQKSILRSSIIQNNLRNSLVDTQKKYAIIRINIGFSNINMSLLTLQGKILFWLNGGSLNEAQSKRTRMTSRFVNELTSKFLINLKKIKNKISFFKILFVGPSKRFRSKFFSIIKRKFQRFRFRILCKEEGFHRSFNGCRLTRKKR
jgi:hypothetical protein